MVITTLVLVTGQLTSEAVSGRNAVVLVFAVVNTVSDSEAGAGAVVFWTGKQ